ncbi:MAG: ROK family protein, partial [Lentisphaeria bacterium]|nr:ROK family protein [Lentisphaeria bacterium]
MADKNNIFGAFDIGGTKCASLIGFLNENEYKVLGRRSFPTSLHRDPLECIARLCKELADLKRELDVEISAIGISCGGPLDNVRGIIQSPPNLPGWDDIEVCDLVEQLAGVPAFLENDANAGAIAEWKYGAGKGVDNMLFLTFGTGLGAGVIIGGNLLYGCNGNAGELGHIRLAPD